ncbi:MAG TPA: M20/M25/M40 family metallo-hydrolase [Thermoanaerobaculia bacterium]|nr:M20/M25/M40 family metallo-hydrolase [Thermoanaerobaculia bacterium]
MSDLPQRSSQAVDPVALARELIDIPSVTGGELEVALFLESFLESHGFGCRRQEVADDRFNLYATAGGKPRVLLCSHIDTVPPFFASSEDDDRISGRGACDTKGIIAAMLAAGLSLKAGGVTDFAYLLVVGEETDSLGAKMANDEFSGLGAEFVVVGEPTESKFANASKGALTCTVRFAGVAAHSAYPERGDSAIMKLVAAVSEIASADWGSDPVLGKATVNVGVIRGGVKPNIIAADAEAEMIFRTVSDPQTVSQKLNAIVGKFDGEIIRSHGNPPMKMLVPAGRPSVVVAFNTDVPHLTRLGVPLLFGPGSILEAHSATEFISKRELLDAVDVYRDLVKTLLERG